MTVAPTEQVWQLVAGEPRAMTPASITHGAIQSEMGRPVANALAEQASPCRVITTPGVIPRVQSETNVRIPDLAVTCSAYHEEEQALTTPILVIEILSPSSKRKLGLMSGTIRRSRAVRKS
jgi:Uma2 family endonuclease